MKPFESNGQRGESRFPRCDRSDGAAASRVADATEATPSSQLAVLRLEEVIAAAVHANRAFAARVHVLVDVAFGRGGTRVRGDAPQLVGVFGRLLHNATHRSAPQGVVEIRVYPSGDRDVAVSVRDHGSGSAADLLGSVFGPAIEGSIVVPLPGAARAGHPVSRRLPELHGGTVAAHEVGPDQGAEFVVTLATAAAGRLSVVPAAEPDVATLRILVVDDHHDSADTLQMMLGVDGHAVEVAYEGGGVVAIVGRFHPDVIILDLDLPDVSGYEVARRVRAIPDAAVLIALTGYGGERYRARAREAGFEHHLLKPIDLALLRKVLVPRGAPATRELEHA